MRLPLNHGLVVLLLATLVAACTAPSSSSVGRSPGESTSSVPSSTTASPSSGPKRIVTAVVGQPNVWVERLRSGPRIGAWNLYELTTAGMTLIDAQGELQPQLAES